MSGAGAEGQGHAPSRTRADAEGTETRKRTRANGPPSQQQVRQSGPLQVFVGALLPYPAPSAHPGVDVRAEPQRPISPGLGAQSQRQRVQQEQERRLSACPKCKDDGEIFYEATGGSRTCMRCGTVVEQNGVDDRPETQRVDGLEVRQGQYVRHGADRGLSMGAAAAGCGGKRAKAYDSLAHQLQQKRKCTQRIRQLLQSLGVQKPLAPQIEAMLEQYANRSNMTGCPSDQVIGSCIYIVCRMNSVPLTLIDVSESVECNVFRLGRTFSKMCKDLNLHLDAPAPELFVDRICAILGIKEPEILQKVKTQSRELIRVAERSSLETGRVPTAVAGAAVSVALVVNGLDPSMKEIAAHLHVANRTMNLRRRELVSTLTQLGQRLPWGKELTVKNIYSHLPFLLENLDLLEPLLRSPVTHEPVVAGAIAEAQNTSSSSPLPTFEPGRMPPSFQKSVKHRSECLKLIKKAVQRIRHKVPSGIDLNLDGLEHELECIADVSLDAAVTEEDLGIEKLLIKGVSARVLLENAGRDIPRTTSEEKDVRDDPDLSDGDLGDDEAALYIRTDDEVRELEEIRRSTKLDAEKARLRKRARNTEARPLLPLVEPHGTTSP